MAEVSRAAVDSMSDIVWAVNPRRDTLLDLLQRMRYYAGEALTGPASGSGGAEVTLEFNAPSTDQSIPVNLRRHLYLFFKEAVTNIVKHSGATVVRIDIAKIGRRLHLRIYDNGRGFVVGEPGQFNPGGNGLQSLHLRASHLNGEILIESSPGNGTTIDLDVPLYYSSYSQKPPKTT
jgi:signal transduction histidine kinase